MSLPAPPVTPGFPVVLSGQRLPGAPAVFRNQGVTSGYRTALARWLAQPDHPLDARGSSSIGCGSNISAAGSSARPTISAARGPLPTHPELLDWLATEFVAQRVEIQIAASADPQVDRLSTVVAMSQPTARAATGERPRSIRHAVDPDNSCCGACRSAGSNRRSSAMRSWR